MKILLFFLILLIPIQNIKAEKTTIIIDNDKSTYNIIKKSYFYLDVEKVQKLSTIQDMIHDNYKFNQYFKLMNSHLIGFYNGKLWIYFCILNISNQKKDLYLLVAPWHIDNIKIYEIQNNSIKYTSLGDHYPFYQRTIKTNDFFYHFNIQSHQFKEFILEIESTSSIQLPLTIFTYEAFIEYIRKNQFIYGSYVGMIIIMILFNFFLFLSINDNIYFYYILFLFFLCLTILSITGYGFEFFWGNYPNFAQIANFILENMTILSAIIFMTAFLNLKNINKKLYYFSFFILGYILISYIYIFFNNIQFINKIILIHLIISSIYLIIVTIYCTYKKNPFAKILLFSWFILIISVFIRTLMDFSQLEWNYHHSNLAIIIGSALDMTLISLGLGLRFKTYIIKSKEYDMEIQFAKDINKFLLPVYPFPEIKNYINFLHIPPRGLGGDLNSFYVLKDCILIVQVDISGHNIGTAVISSLLKGYIEQIVDSHKLKKFEGNITKDIINLIHNYITERLEHHHLSMIVSLIELSKRKVTIARAGHPYPILIKKEKEFKILETNGSIIHPKFFIEPELKSFSLSEGDTIYFYSDGLFDLNLFKNKNRANELEICEFFNKINHLNLNDIIKIIYENYKEEPHKIQIDDISLIIFRYKKELINLLKQKWDLKNNL